MFAVIGTTTADLFIAGIDRMPQFDGDEFTTSSLAFCRDPLTMTLGGNGANSAYVLRTLGAPVMLCSATGMNTVGKTVTGWLAERDIDLRGFVRREGGSATTTTIMDNQRNRLSFYYDGLFPTLGAADLPDALWSEARTLLVTGLPLLPGLRGDMQTVLTRAHAAGIRTALDIGPAIGIPATLDELRPLLPLLDLLLTNAYELGVATGSATIEDGAAQLRETGARQVIVKLGAEGAYLDTPEFTGRVSGFPVEASVTIGAGDSFNAGLLYALAEGMPLDEATAFANATAALVVQTGQSVLGAPTPEQVRALWKREKCDE